MSPGNLRGTLITAADGSRMVISETSPITVLRYSPPDSNILYAVDVVSDGTSDVTFVVPELGNLKLTIGPIVAYYVDRLDEADQPIQRQVFLNSGPFAEEVAAPTKRPLISLYTSSMDWELEEDLIPIFLDLKHFRLSAKDNLAIYVASEPNDDAVEAIENLRMYAAQCDPYDPGRLKYCPIEEVGERNGRPVIKFWHEHTLRTFDAGDTVNWDFLNANNYDIMTGENVVTVYRRPNSPARIPKYLCMDDRNLIYLSCGPDRNPRSYRIQSGNSGGELTTFNSARLDIGAFEIVVRGMYAKGSLILPTLVDGANRQRSGYPRIKSHQVHMFNYLWIADYDIEEMSEQTIIRLLNTS